MPIRIVVADDHAVVRDGLSALLREQMDIEVVGSAKDGLETVRSCRSGDIDVVVMDLGMPSLDGLEATRIIRRECPLTRVVALTVHTESSYVCRALEAGVSAYVLKSSDIGELSAAIRSAALGEVYLDRAAQAALVADHAATQTGGTRASLSEREKEILALLAKGYSATQAASRLHLSRKTVEAHRRKIKLKLGVESTAELVLYAVREGYITVE